MLIGRVFVVNLLVRHNPFVSVCLFESLYNHIGHFLRYGHHLNRSLDYCIFINSIFCIKQVYQRLDWKKKTVIPFAKRIFPNTCVTYSIYDVWKNGKKT